MLLFFIVIETIVCQALFPFFHCDWLLTYIGLLFAFVLLPIFIPIQEALCSALSAESFYHNIEIVIKIR